MENKYEHIKYLEVKLDAFLILKNHTPRKTQASYDQMQSIINTVRGYVLCENPELYSYADPNVDDSEFFSDKYFGDELGKLIKNLKAETNL